MPYSFWLPPYLQTLDQARKACQGQTLQLITKIRKLREKRFYNIGPRRSTRKVIHSKTLDQAVNRFAREERSSLFVRTAKESFVDLKPSVEDGEENRAAILAESMAAENLKSFQIPIQQLSNWSNPNTDKPIDIQIRLNIKEYWLISE